MGWSGASQDQGPNNKDFQSILILIAVQHKNKHHLNKLQYICVNSHKDLEPTTTVLKDEVRDDGWIRLLGV